MLLQQKQRRGSIMMSATEHGATDHATKPAEYEGNDQEHDASGDQQNDKTVGRLQLS